MNTSIPTISAVGTGRAKPDAKVGGYISESELSKLIRYGCQFELEVHQMAELSQLRDENQRLRRSVRTGGTASGADQ